MSATTLDRADALAIVNEFVREHADEILLNGGALTPELEQLLDEALGDFNAKVDGVAAKWREFEAAAATAKAEKDYYQQRQRMWEGAVSSLKSYLHRCLVRAGEPKVKTARTTVWLHPSPPSLHHAYDGAALLEIVDAPIEDELHPLASYITVNRVATLDTRALLAAYQAREAELREEAAALELTDDETMNVIEDADDKICAQEEAGGADATAEWAAGVRQWHLDAALETKRAEHVRDGLAAAFPGVTVTHSQHVRQR